MNLHHCEIMAMFDTSFRVINVTIWEYRVTYQCFPCWEVPGFQPMLPVVTTRTRNKVKIISKTVIYWLKMLILKNWISLRKKMVCNISLGIEIRTLNVREEEGKRSFLTVKLIVEIKIISSGPTHIEAFNPREPSKTFSPKVWNIQTHVLFYCLPAGPHFTRDYRAEL